MLYRAFLLLSMSFFLAMDGTMAQWTTGTSTSEIVVTGGPAPAPTTTYLNVHFFHDTNTNTAVSYYYAGCENALSGITGVTDVSSGAYAAPAPAPGSSTCGVGGNLVCGARTTYQYTLQLLNAITNQYVKSGSGSPTNPYKVKFCVRHSLRDSNNFVRGYKEADVEVSWESDTSFDNVVTTTESGPDDLNPDVGDVSVTAQLCDSSGTLPTEYNQGESIQICLTASVAGSVARVVIVEINELRFWIDNPLQGTDNVYDDQEVTQVGITTSAGGVTSTVGTTTVLPNDVIGALAGTCDQSFTGYAPTSLTGSGCVLTTFLGPLFFPSTGSNQVKYAGRVTVQFTNGNRRSLALKNGDKFAKTFGSVVTTVSRAAEDDSCECGGFFFFFCIIMCFISSIIG